MAEAVPALGASCTGGEGFARPSTSASPKPHLQRVRDALASRLRLPIVLTLVASVMGGCSGEPQSSESPAPEEVAGSASEPATDSGATVQRPLLAVDGEGLRMVDPASGSTTPIPFGASTDLALERVAAAVGREPDERGDGAECGPTSYATWEDVISIWTDPSGFAGWSLFDADSPLTNMAGIGIGSTLGELRNVMTVEIQETTIGTEFTTGGMAGLLDGTTDDARITHLWAGVTCIAR